MVPSRIVLFLSPETSNHIQHNREHDAQHDRRRQRKIKRSILSAIENVSRQTANWQASLSQQNQHNAGHQQKYTQSNQHLAQICHKQSLDDN